MAPDPVTHDMPDGPAPGVLLVASRSFRDPYFSASVVYLLQHDAHGTVGVIVNHPTPIRLTDWLPELDNTALASRTLHSGGPVNPEIMTIVVQNRDWREQDDSGLVFHVSGDVFASYDPRPVLDRLLQDNAKPFPRVRCYFGHIGWYAGQLEREISHHYWHLLPGDVNAVLGTETGSLWERLIDRLEPTDLYLPPGISLRTRPR